MCWIAIHSDTYLADYTPLALDQKYLCLTGSWKALLKCTLPLVREERVERACLDAFHLNAPVADAKPNHSQNWLGTKKLCRKGS
jgi:hypothetical protein